MVEIHKPPWLEHANENGKRHRIFTLHVHPDGSRVATGGMDTLIRVWNARPLLCAEEDRDPEQQYLLSTIAYATGAIMCVRWSSGDGRLLAAACDDGKVLILERDRTGLRGSLGDANREAFALQRSLTLGHTDVTEVAWSPDGSLLAACTLDGWVVVWNRDFARVARFRAHADFTKGLAWDPLGTYLATASDDRTVKLWRTDRWTEEKTVSEPFRGAPAVTMYRRLSFSPEGSFLAAPVAANALLNVASLISRKHWRGDVSIAGHGAAVECAVFAPTLYEVVEGSQRRYVSLVALGGQDHSVSVTSSSSRCALFAALGVFSRPVVDLAWAPDGLHLLACSMDGSVAVLGFDESEVGRPLSPAELQPILADMGAAHLHRSVPLETAGQLALERASSRATAAPPAAPPTAPHQVAQPAQVPVTPQKVSLDPRTGRRRIQPQLISTLDGSPVAAQSRIVNTLPPAASPAPPRSTVIPTGSTSQKSTRVDPTLFPKLLALGSATYEMPTRFSPKIKDRLVHVFSTSRQAARPEYAVVATNRIPVGSFVLELRALWSPDARWNVDESDETHRDLPKSRPVWSDWTLSAAVVAAAASESVLVVGLADNSLVFYSAFGRRMIPPVALEAPVVALAAGREHAAAIDGHGRVHLWQLARKSESGWLRPTLKLSTSLAAVATAPRPDGLEAAEPLGVIGLALGPADGAPIVTMSDLETYTFDWGAGAWIKLSQSSTAAKILGARAEAAGPGEPLPDYASPLLAPVTADVAQLLDTVRRERPLPLPQSHLVNATLEMAVDHVGAVQLGAPAWRGSQRHKNDAEARWLEAQIGALELAGAPLDAIEHATVQYAAALARIGRPALGRARELLLQVSPGHELGSLLSATSLPGRVRVELSRSRELQALLDTAPSAG